MLAGIPLHLTLALHCIADRAIALKEVNWAGERHSQMSSFKRIKNGGPVALLCSGWRVHFCTSGMTCAAAPLGGSF